LNGIVNSLRRLEDRFERLVLWIQDIYAALQKALQQIRDLQTAQAPPISSVTTTVWSIPAVVIAAGGNVTGQTVSALSAGSLVTAFTNATVYNQMAAATVSTTGKTIMVGANGDGTFSAISQSC
jgi:hypothetical protein